MNEKIYKQVRELKEAIDSDQRVVRLNELDKEVNEDAEVKRLFAVLKEKEDAFVHCVSGEKAEANHELHEVKLALDSLPLAKEYNTSYIEVRDLCMMIDDILFGPYRKKTPHIKE